MRDLVWQDVILTHATRRQFKSRSPTGSRMEANKRHRTTPGVYLIVKKAKGRRVPVYVGSTDSDIMQTVDEFQNGIGRKENPGLYDFVKDAEWVSFCFTPMPNAANRCCYARYFYDLYSKKYALYNRRRPECDGDCSGIDVKGPV